jgi:hypothetical protein
MDPHDLATAAKLIGIALFITTIILVAEIR